MLCKFNWIVLYTVHFTAFCLGGPFFPGHGVGLLPFSRYSGLKIENRWFYPPLLCLTPPFGGSP